MVLDAHAVLLISLASSCKFRDICMLIVKIISIFTLYGGSRTTIPLKGGKVALEQESGYPFDGKVRLVVIPEKKERFSISMRIPTWATKDEFVPGGLYPYEEQRHLPVEVRVNGEK